MGINLLIPGTFAKWLGEGFLNIKPQRNTREGVKTYDVRSRNPSTGSFWERARPSIFLGRSVSVVDILATVVSNAASGLDLEKQVSKCNSTLLRTLVTKPKKINRSF